jgi:hypothetical protein
MSLRSSRISGCNGAARRQCWAARFMATFQRRSLDGSHSNRTLASPACCSFLRDGRAERHSAVQRIPRSHSSASLRSRSAVALSSVARASLRYRIARALLMASQIPARQNGDSSKSPRAPKCEWRMKLMPGSRTSSGPSAGALRDRRDRPAIWEPASRTLTSGRPRVDSEKAGRGRCCKLHVSRSCY